MTTSPESSDSGFGRDAAGVSFADARCRFFFPASISMDLPRRSTTPSDRRDADACGP